VKPDLPVGELDVRKLASAGEPGGTPTWPAKESINLSADQ
jgi:hypothetical protein